MKKGESFKKVKKFCKTRNEPPGSLNAGKSTWGEHLMADALLPGV
jgi:hypothetical protein